MSMRCGRVGLRLKKLKQLQQVWAGFVGNWLFYHPDWLFALIIISITSLYPLQFIFDVNMPFTIQESRQIRNSWMVLGSLVARRNAMTPFHAARWERFSNVVTERRMSAKYFFGAWYGRWLNLINWSSLLCFSWWRRLSQRSLMNEDSQGFNDLIFSTWRNWFMCSICRSINVFF